MGDHAGSPLREATTGTKFPEFRIIFIFDTSEIKALQIYVALSAMFEHLPY
jgi:hypothetical protein